MSNTIVYSLCIILHPRTISRRPRSPHPVPSHLKISWTAQRKFETDTTASQFSVNLGESVESVIHTSTLLFVQDDLEGLATVFLGSESLAHNLHRVDNVGEDGIVNRGQGSRTRTLLGLRGAGAVAALGAREDAARGEDEDMTVGELLLEFADQALLDFVEVGQQGNGDEDDNGALAVADFELWKIKIVSMVFCLWLHSSLDTSVTETRLFACSELGVDIRVLHTSRAETI